MLQLKILLSYNKIDMAKHLGLIMDIQNSKSVDVNSTAGRAQKGHLVMR